MNFEKFKKLLIAQRWRMQKGTEDESNWLDCNLDINFNKDRTLLFEIEFLDDAIKPKRFPLREYRIDGEEGNYKIVSRDDDPDFGTVTITKNNLEPFIKFSAEARLDEELTFQT
jgi:hypothetical protein